MLKTNPDENNHRATIVTQLPPIMWKYYQYLWIWETQKSQPVLPVLPTLQPHGQHTKITNGPERKTRSAVFLCEIVVTQTAWLAGLEPNVGKRSEIQLHCWNKVTVGTQVRQIYQEYEELGTYYRTLGRHSRDDKGTGEEHSWAESNWGDRGSNTEHDIHGTRT